MRSPAKKKLEKHWKEIKKIYEDKKLSQREAYQYIKKNAPHILVYYPSNYHISHEVVGQKTFRDWISRHPQIKMRTHRQAKELKLKAKRRRNNDS